MIIQNGQHPLHASLGTVRICGDFKTTLNPVMKVEYPFPRIEDIFTSLAGGVKFSTIYLTQMEIDKESNKRLVINIHKGLYRYTRLPIGIVSAPALWQRPVDQFLQYVCACVYERRKYFI